MKKLNLLDTEFAKIYNMSRMAKDAGKYLVMRKSSMDLSQDRYLSIMANINPMVTSHMNTLFKNLISKDKLKSLYLFSVLRGGVTDLPELLTIDDVTIDGKFVDLTLPDDLQRAWVNLTSVMSFNKQDRAGLLQVNDIPKAVSSTVRAFLCMSYNDSKEWLSPRASVFLIEFYTMAMSLVMDRLFTLDYEESVLPNLLFAWHYAELLSNPDEKSKVPALLTKSTRIFKGNMSGAQIDELISKVLEIKGDEMMSMGMVAKCIKALGTSRMSKIQKSDFYRYFAVASSDNAPMMLAMDYPPYLLHQILKVAGGGKHYIMSSVFKNRFQKRDIMQMLDQIVMDKALIEGVKR